MELEHLLSLLFLFFMALIFLVLAFIYRSQWWWGTVSALMWFLLGIVSIQYGQTDPVFYYERELGVVWLVIALGMFFVPFFIRRKQDSAVEDAEKEARDEYMRNMQEYRDNVNEYRKMGMQPRKPKRPRTILYGRGRGRQ